MSSDISQHPSLLLLNLTTWRTSGMSPGYVSLTQHPNLVFPVVGSTKAYHLTLLPPFLSQCTDCYYFQKSYFFISHNISSSPFNSLLFPRKLRNLKNCYNLIVTNSYRDLELWAESKNITGSEQILFTTTKRRLWAYKTCWVDPAAVWIFKTWSLVVNGKRQCNNVRSTEEK